MKYGHWICPFAFEAHEWAGMVYLIINKQTGRGYIGRKNFASNRAVKVKCITKPGKKTARRITESNWKTYTSSSRQVNADINIHGKENFHFEILSVHQTKSSLNYEEAAQMYANQVLTALLPDGSPAWYNQQIPAVRSRPQGQVLR